MIHPTAIIHPRAQIGPGTRVGPYSVIEEGVRLGPDCEVGPHVHLLGNTTAGAGNRFFTGCVIGNAPQDLKYKGEPSNLRIGDGNTFRENVTVNRSTAPADSTVLGSNNLLMAGCHVGHDVVVGNHTILVNGCAIGGHVVIGDRVLVSANCLVHQFVRIGSFAMMQGGAAISQDLPPFCVARGPNGMCGLNILGLRRGGFTPADRLELKSLYLLLFRSGLRLAEAVTKARAQATTEAGRALVEFVAVTKRGIVRDTGLEDGGTDDGD